MNSPLVIALAAAVALLIGTAAGYLIRGNIERSRQEKERAAAQDDASKILARANEEAEGLKKTRVLEGKEEVFGLREVWEKDEARRRDDVERLEVRVSERSDSLDRRLEEVAGGFPNHFPLAIEHRDRVHATSSQHMKEIGGLRTSAVRATASLMAVIPSAGTQKST